ncbi:MAG: xanthine dehydrogenase family protein subunit M [SAR324 cluster bacterium]|nr:xanthine dehydrogenase family protein subunit M [SAR324 cluster bacterium]
MLFCDQYHVPETLHEAFDLINTNQGSYKVLAGATDLLPWAREGRGGDVNFESVIDISKITDMSEWQLQGDRISLGANVTMQQLLEDPFLRKHIPVMAKSAVWFADDQIREQATLGGNLVNASPAADATPPMLAMNAELTLQRKHNGKIKHRKLSLDKFVTGPGKTSLEDGELVTRIECDSMPGYGSAFEKVGHRRSLVISTVCLAALVSLSDNGRQFEDVRLALGGVGPVPVRLHESESCLISKPVETELINKSSELAVKHVQSRTRQEYRREVVFNFVKRGIMEAIKDFDTNCVKIDMHTQPEKNYG